MRKLIVLVIIVFNFFLFNQSVLGEERIRIATYNIKFLNKNISTERLKHLKDVIKHLDADIIGLQEIDDRQALEGVFPKNEWHIIIDDDSNEKQDLALVVKKHLNVKGFDDDILDADDKHFLFPQRSDWKHFPKRRDLLFVEIELKQEPYAFFVMVHHAKARKGGRASTDERRAGAARALVKKLERDFDEKDFFLVGDMNDSPDDRSLNILETGNPNAPIAMENEPGEFMVNLTEHLFAAGHVSFGKNTRDLIKPGKERVNTTDSNAREKNYINRTNDNNIGDCLFDQILIPQHMEDKYIIDSAKVFDHKSGVLGNSKTRASDHLPVYADFVLGADEEEEEIAAVRIFSVLPNPGGTDSGNEEVTLANDTKNEIDLTGWGLQDRAENRYMLSGKIAAEKRLAFKLEGNRMPLNNNGDEVLLIDNNGNIRDRISYSKQQVKEGKEIFFD